MSGFYSDKNSSRVLQPPGGSSSGIFGGPAGDAQTAPSQKPTSARSASNIFGPAETESPSRRVNTRMQSDIFGTTGGTAPSQQPGRADRMKSDIFGGEAAAQEPARQRKDRMSSDIFKEPGPSDQVMPRKLKGKEEDVSTDPQAFPAAGDVDKYDGGKADLDRAPGGESQGRVAEAQAGSGDACDEVSYYDTNHDTAITHSAPAPMSTTTGGENIFDVRYGYTPQKPGRRLAQGTQPDMAATFLNLFGTSHPDGPGTHPPPTGQPPAPTSMPAEALGYKPAPAEPAGHRRAAAGVVSGARDPRGPSAVFPEEQTASSNWRPSAKYRLRYQAALVNPITGETYASPDFDPPHTTNGTANGCGEDENPLDGETPAERPSTKVMQPPGGGSQITLG
ncbi:hypothetical protein Bbelb_315850 [Branchiostoma belcheri]|nr:hypothetical protein Bbelb_315850 [Branchiostoma belcheri]